MYVAPRPRVEDDPLFAVRLAAGAVAGFLVAIVVQSPLPTLFPSLTIGILGGMRQAFDPKKALGGPLAMIVTVCLMSGLVGLTRPMPLVLVTVTGILCVLAYYMILKTGGPFGMLIAVVAVLMSVMGMNSLSAMHVMRDAFVEASLGALVTVPLLYALLPPTTREVFVEVYEPAGGGHDGLRALIRGGVLLLLTFWLYTILETSNLVLAIAAIFVLVFPTVERQFAEAWQRTFATALGGGMALAILGLFTVVAHLPVLLLLIFFAGLFLGGRMMGGGARRWSTSTPSPSWSSSSPAPCRRRSRWTPRCCGSASRSRARSWRCSCRRCSKRSFCPPADGGARSYRKIRILPPWTPDQVGGDNV